MWPAAVCGRGCWQLGKGNRLRLHLCRGHYVEKPDKRARLEELPKTFQPNHDLFALQARSFFVYFHTMEAFMTVLPQPKYAPASAKITQSAPSLTCLLTIIPSIYHWLIGKKGFSDSAASIGVMAALTAGIRSLVTGQARDLKNHRGWLLSVAFKSASRASRREIPSVPLEVAEFTAHRLPDVEVDVEEQEERESLARDTRAGVEDLPEFEKQAIRLTYFEQLSNRRGAMMMGVTVSTFRRYLEAGRQRLKAILSLPPNRGI
jgi:RNA polymerase sigma factor (sigma-70 family)